MQSPLFRSFVFATVLSLVAVALCGCGGGGSGGGDKPTTTVTTTTLTTTTTNDHCLCVFDVDRTLTASQNSDCPDAVEKPGVVDPAYGGGTLKLSQLAVNMGKTFCARCYHAVVTRGDAGGDAGGHDSKERVILFNDVLGPVNYTKSNKWGMWKQGPDGPSQDPNWHATSSLVFFTNDGSKHQAVKSIVEEFFLGSHNILISDYNVHFFDDREDNVKPFEKTSYNAHQVSCAARDPDINNVGKCGGVVSEIIESPGGVMTLCSTHEEKVVV